MKRVWRLDYYHLKSHLVLDANKNNSSLVRCYVYNNFKEKIYLAHIFRVCIRRLSNEEKTTRKKEKKQLVMSFSNIEMLKQDFAQ